MPRGPGHRTDRCSTAHPWAGRGGFGEAAVACPAQDRFVRTIRATESGTGVRAQQSTPRTASCTGLRLQSRYKAPGTARPQLLQNSPISRVKAV
jgi:hypothetical protein